MDIDHSSSGSKVHSLFVSNPLYFFVDIRLFFVKTLFFSAFLLTAPATNIATLGTVLKATGGLDRLAPIRSAFAIFFLAFIMSYVLDYTCFFALNTNLGEAIETIVLPDWWSNGSVVVCGCMVLISLGIRIFNLFHCSKKNSSKSVGNADNINKTIKLE